MDFIVVYDKSKAGNPIVAIHSHRLRDQETVTLKDIHPDDDPNERGAVVVPGEIINQMVIRKYKRDKAGKTVQKPLLLERTKDLISVMDSSLKQNVLIFGESCKELARIVDLAGKAVPGSVLNETKGIIGIGDKSGHFTVTCRIDTGNVEPVVVSEKENWKWEKDTQGNIVGMKLIKTAAPESGE